MTPPATATATAAARRPATERPAARPRPAAAPQRAPLRGVAPEGRRRAGGRRITELLALAIVVAALLAVVCAHAMLAVGQVRLSSIQTQLNAEQAVHRQEVAAVASLETPSRIVSQSEQQLHMGTPAQIHQLSSVPLTTPLPAPKLTTPVAAATPATTSPTSATTPTTTAPAGAAG